MFTSTHHGHERPCSFLIWSFNGFYELFPECSDCAAETTTLSLLGLSLICRVHIHSLRPFKKPLNSWLVTMINHSWDNNQDNGKTTKHTLGRSLWAISKLCQNLMRGNLLGCSSLLWNGGRPDHCPQCDITMDREGANQETELCSKISAFKLVWTLKLSTRTSQTPSGQFDGETEIQMFGHNEKSYVWRSEAFKAQEPWRQRHAVEPFGGNEKSEIWPEVQKSKDN